MVSSVTKKWKWAYISHLETSDLTFPSMTSGGDSIQTVKSTVHTWCTWIVKNTFRFRNWQVWLSTRNRSLKFVCCRLISIFPLLRYNNSPCTTLFTSSSAENTRMAQEQNVSTSGRPVSSKPVKSTTFVCTSRMYIRKFSIVLGSNPCLEFCWKAAKAQKTQRLSLGFLFVDLLWVRVHTLLEDLMKSGISITSWSVIPIGRRDKCVACKETLVKQKKVHFVLSRKFVSFSVKLVMKMSSSVWIVQRFILALVWVGPLYCHLSSSTDIRQFRWLRKCIRNWLSFWIPSLILQTLHQVLYFINPFILQKNNNSCLVGQQNNLIPHIVSLSTKKLTQWFIVPK